MNQHCPGLYCGKIVYPNNTFSDCGKCPLGYRSSNYLESEVSLCLKCNSFLELYDWLYLFSIFFLHLVIEFYLIDSCLKTVKITLKSVVLYLSSLCEILCSSLLSTYLYTGFEYYLPICKPRNIKDWYTYLENPQINGETLSCTRELVYPLFTLPFVYLFFTSVFLLLFRPYLVKTFEIKHGDKTVYFTMYLIPVLGLFHSIFSGIYYFSYPYFLFFLSICSLSVYLASQNDQTTLGLLKIFITNSKPLYVIIGFWVLHLLSLLAIIELKNSSYKLILLTPVPTFYYIITSRYTSPKVIKNN